MKKLLFSAILFSSFTLISCASIISGGSQKLTFNSDPQGAKVQVINKNGKLVKIANTPFTAKLKRGSDFFTGEDYTVKYTLENYQPYETNISTSLNGWYVGNFIFGGLLGFLIIDPLTGAMWKIDSEEVNVILKKEVVGFYILKKNDDVPQKLKSIPYRF
jgi:hypothetical protein